MERKVNVVEDLDGNKIVFIHDIRFKGKRSVEWDDVEAYLRQFVGEMYYTKILKGANAKAKANAAQGLPEMIEIAKEKKFKQNFKEKHDKDAKYVRHAFDDKLYLYDIMNIKKETSILFQP